MIARKLAIAALTLVATSAMAQVPDLLTAFDAGGRAYGSGGAFNSTGADTLSGHYNPAGLGYVGTRTVGFATRNFPTTRTDVTGSIDDLRLSSDEESGDLRASHVGVAIPLNGNRGTLGISWTVGGWMHDDQIGQNISPGIARFLDAVRVKTDYLNISWGKTSGDQTVSWGIGLVGAYHSVYNRRRLLFSDPNIPTQLSSSDDSAFGVGLQAGILITPANRSNLTFGLSARTPIELDDEGAVSLNSRIPGRIAAGMAFRQDGLRGGKDYLVWGAEVEHFFSTESSDRIQQESHTAARFGLEYNYAMGNAVIPVRLGYMAIPAGGDDFDNRNTFTYGIGYRPNNRPWMLQVNFGNSNGGARDTAIYVSYRF
jgi:hypothetical protein